MLHSPAKYIQRLSGAVYCMALGRFIILVSRALQRLRRATGPRHCGRYWGHIKRPQSATWSLTPFARHWTFTLTSRSQILNYECSLDSGLSLQLDRATVYVRQGPPKNQLPRRNRRKLFEGTHWEWVKNWTRSTGHPDDCWNPKAATARDWETR